MTSTQVSSQCVKLCHLPSELPCNIEQLGNADLAEPDAKEQISKLIREFEIDVAYADRCLQKSIRRNAAYLIPEAEQSTLPSRAQAILGRYAVVDTLALRYRKRTTSIFIGLLAIAFFAMMILEFFAHILLELPVGAKARLVLWLYPALWLTALGLWYLAHSRLYQKKYHDYRALAEGLRVQFFWNLLGLSDRVEENYLRKQQGELEWIRCAIAWWHDHDEKTIPAVELSAEQRTAQKELVCRCWVQGQLDYFTKAAPREGHRGKRCKRWGAVLFWTSFGLAIILGAIQTEHIMHASADTHSKPSTEESALIFAIAMFLTGAAIAVAYGEKMAFSEHTRQYAATRVLFHRHALLLKAGPLTPAEIEIFRTLGKEALQENGDWLLLHRDRPLEIVVP